MPVELSDEQYAVLTKASQFLTEAAQSPATRREFERMAKKLRPDIETTDDIAAAAAAPYIEQIETSNRRLDDFLTAQQKRDQDAVDAQADHARDEAFGRLKAEGYTEDGIEKITRLMIERNIADPEAAAALFDRQNPKPLEGHASWEPDSWNIRDEAVDRDVSGLFENEDKWADREVANVLNEIRMGNRA